MAMIRGRRVNPHHRDQVTLTLVLRGGGREQAQGAGVVHRLVTGVDAELGVQVAPVSADGVHRHEQLSGDLVGGEVSRQVTQDAGLAVGELFYDSRGDDPPRPPWSWGVARPL